jgi:hypothetical protein
MPEVCLAIETSPVKSAAAGVRSAACIRKPPKRLAHHIDALPRFASAGKKKAFNSHRFVPAQFNEFYPKRSGPTDPLNPHHLPPEHSG